LARLVVQPLAWKDLVDITRSGAERWGRDAARAYAKSFDETFELLRRHPLAGRNRSELFTGLRSRRHRAHIVYYLANQQEVIVVRILHSAADPATVFGGE
jgi:toxin ParE1/3/4